MNLGIRCVQCSKYYPCSQRNTKLLGPIIKTTCPFCGHSEERNYSAFLDSQFNPEKNGVTLHNLKAGGMIALARAISSIVSNEESFKRKK